MFACCCASDNGGPVEVIDQIDSKDADTKEPPAVNLEGAPIQDEGTFVVEVEKTATVKSAGIIVGRFGNEKYQQHLQVRDIKEGLIQNYNNFAESGKKVNQGDFIVEVNGVRGDSKAMLAKVASDQQLRFVVKPKDA